MPEHVIWNASLETGIRAIDLQHEELIGMVNELADAIERQQGECAGQDILRRLDAYILFHFATEENLMGGLAGAQAHSERHAEQHRAFVAHIAALKAGTADAPGQAAEALLDYLRDWLLEHIMKTDRVLGALLQEAAGKH